MKSRLSSALTSLVPVARSCSCSSSGTRMRTRNLRNLRSLRSCSSRSANSNDSEQARRIRIHPLAGFLSTARCLSTTASSSSSYPTSALTSSRSSRGPVLSNVNAVRRNMDGGAVRGAVSAGRRGEIGRRRGLHASSVRRHGGIDRPAPGTGIKVTFKDSKGTILKTVEANEGDDILSIAHEYDIDLEGACEGSVACSTCHVILDPQSYDLLPEPSDDENDMLDMAFGLTDTSRLGCQIKVTKELDGITCTLPAATRNMYVDGAKPHH